MSPFLVPDNSCVVVVVPLAVNDNEAEQANDCLDLDEKLRADRYVTPELRRRFSVCRGRLRILLGNILDIPPAKIAFQYGIRGKPAIAFDTDLQFNVSHSQDWALIAFARGSSVGVDLELVDRNINVEAIANQLLNARDFAKWICLPETSRHEVLLSLWVAKESVLKSVGIGIAESLRKLVLPIPVPRDGFSLTLDDILLDVTKEQGRDFEAAKAPGQEWRLRFINELSFAKAAICYQRHIELQKIFHWDDGFALS